MQKKDRLLLINTLFWPVFLEYESPVLWDLFFKKSYQSFTKDTDGNEVLRIIFNIKGPTSFLQLRHDTNILPLEERCKEI